MAANQEKLVDLNGIGAVRDWANGKFALPGYSKQMVDTVYVAEQTFTPQDMGGIYGAPVTLASSDPLPDSMTVVKDGTSYTAPKQAYDTGSAVITAYGADFEGVLSGSPDWSVYPFLLYSAAGQSAIVVPSADSFTFKASGTPTEKMVITDDFREAVHETGSPGYEDGEDKTILLVPETTIDTSNGTANLHPAVYEMYPVYENGFPPSIRVTFDGTEYTMERSATGYGEAATGTYDEYPVGIYFDTTRGVGAYSLAVNTETAGEHTISIECAFPTAKPNDDFTQAVLAAGNGFPFVVSATAVHESLSGSGATLEATLSATWNEIWGAYSKGRSIWLDVSDITDSLGYLQLSYINTTLLDGMGFSAEAFTTKRIDIGDYSNGKKASPCKLTVRIRRPYNPSNWDSPISDAYTNIEFVFYPHNQGYDNVFPSSLDTLAFYQRVTGTEYTFTQERPIKNSDISAMPDVICLRVQGEPIELKKASETTDPSPVVTYRDPAITSLVLRMEWSSTPSPGQWNAILSSTVNAMSFWASLYSGGYTVTPSESFKRAVQASSGLPAVTSEDNGDLLTVVDGAWAKGAPGYRVSKSFTTVVPEQSVTTALGETGFCAGDLTDVVAPTSLADVPDKLKVVLNGSNYTLPLEPSLGAFYGEYNASSGPIFTTYPCALMIDGITNMFITPEAGTYTVSADKVIETVTPDDHFKAAVAESGIGAPLVVKFTLDNSDPIAPGSVEQTVVASHTYDEIMAEYNKGRPVLFDCFIATGVPSIGSYNCYGSPVLRSDNKLWLDAMFPVVSDTTLHIFNVEAIIGSGDYLTVFWTRYTLTEAT